MGVTSVAAFAWCAWQIRAVVGLHEQFRHWTLGLRGEQAVAESLADPEIAKAGYSAFHDVPGSDGKWNIDHVVVGPGGVFVIETKTRSKRKATRDQQEHQVFFDGHALLFPWGDDDKAAAQVQANANWIRKFLDGYGPKKLVTHPVIVLPGWYVMPKGDYAVKALASGYLRKFLLDAKRLYREDEMEVIRKRLDEHCRTVEF